EMYQPVRARERFDLAKSLAPADYRPAYNRGLSLHQSGQRAEAEAEFSAAIALAPTLPDPYFQRAVVRVWWKPADALADLGRAAAAARGGVTPPILHVRATAHDDLARRAATAADKAREAALAEADRAALLRTEPKTAKDFAVRGFAILKDKPADALAAFRRAT